MKIKRVNLRNFRRLEDVAIDFEAKETVFVGPNNSGKTSATSAFRLFIKGKDFKIYDFSVPSIATIDTIGEEGKDLEFPSIEMDIWLSIDPDFEYGRAVSLLPGISAAFEEVGVRIRYGIKDLEKLKEEYFSVFPEQTDGSRNRSLSHFLSSANNLTFPQLMYHIVC